MPKETQGNFLLSCDGSGTGSVTDRGPGAVGVILRNPRGAVIATLSMVIEGGATNTEAEYAALIEGLKLAKSRGIDRIRAFVDSELVVDQLHNRAEAKREHIKPLQEEARKALATFSNWRLSWVPRAWNSEADALATHALHEASPVTEPSTETPLDEGTRDSDAPVIDPEGLAIWISERTYLPQEVVSRVLDLEFEFMVALGIIHIPDYSFSYYSPEELQDTDKVVDTQRLAEDAERLVHVPAQVASLIFDTEYQFLRMRGLAS